MLISVKGPGTPACRARTGRRRESSVVNYSSALTSGNHREGKEERSAFTPGTLCENHLIEVDSLCIQDIWGPNQHYSSLVPLERSQRRLGRIQQSREQKKHRKPHNAESLLVKDQAAPCFHAQVTERKAHGCILRLRRQRSDPGTALLF